MEECEAKINEYDNKVKEIESTIAELKQRHLSVLADGSCRKVTQSKINVLENNMTTTLNQIQSAATMVTDDISPANKHVLEAILGMVGNMVEHFKAALDDKAGMFEDQQDTLNNQDVAVDIEVEQPESTHDGISDDFYETIQDQQLASQAGAGKSGGKGKASATRSHPYNDDKDVDGAVDEEVVKERAEAAKQRADQLTGQAPILQSGASSSSKSNS